MEECEFCGRSTKNIYVVDVENVELRACASCAKGKHIVRTELEAQPKKPGYQPAKRIREEDYELVEDYASVIRKAREGMKLPVKVLAEMLSEKEHLLTRIEEQKTRPTIALTKKLEKALRIKLTQAPTEEKATARTGKASEATIGDFVEE